MRELELMTLIGRRPDVVHVHWPDHFIARRLSPHRLIHLGVMVLLAKCRGARLVWTVHNVAPRDPKVPKRNTAPGRTRYGFDWSMVLIYLTADSQRELEERYREAKGKFAAIIPHGNYRPMIASPCSRDAARNALGLPVFSFLVAAIGMIKPCR
ncbi:MAG: hypothetical protein U5O39_10320 [Gammaproteobacteria bacterium]|nr:hypothetical protein [Gammaproteobacteria bacterium]